MLIIKKLKKKDDGYYLQKYCFQNLQLVTKQLVLSFLVIILTDIMKVIHIHLSEENITINKGG